MKTEDELNEMNVPELKAYAHDNNVEIKGNLSKETLVERILASQVDESEFKAPETELEPPEKLGEIVPERLELQDGSFVDRRALLKATARDYGLSIQEWNKLEDKDKERKVKGFVSTLDLKQVEPESIGSTEKTSKSAEEHINEVLKRYVDHGLKIDFDNTGLTMVFGNKAPIWIHASSPDAVLDREARKMVFA